MERKNIQRKKTILSSLILTSAIIMSGCVKDVECDINYSHAHYYEDDNDLKRLVDSEKEYIGSFERKDDYVIIGSDVRSLLLFERENKLININLNEDAIKKMISQNEDFTEYKFSYLSDDTIPSYNVNGQNVSINYSCEPEVCYSWTTDESHEELTGKKRVVHYMYYGYKVTIDEKGNFILKRSDAVDSLEDLPLEYQYICLDDFSKMVYLDNKSKEIEYGETTYQKEDILRRVLFK